MRVRCNGLPTKNSAQKASYRLASGWIAAWGCALLASTAFAADKPSRAERKVAKKIDEGTRIGADSSDKHPLAPVLAAAREARARAAGLEGYTATFIKQELTTKKGLVRQAMQIKFRREPFSVYLKFIEPHEGREVIFVEGKNKGKMQVHEASGIASLAGTISVNPHGDEALKENRYPITNFGMEKLMDAIVEQLEGELKHAESTVQVYPQAKIGELECRMFEVTHPKERPHFRFHKTRLYVDRQSGLPVRTEQYGFPRKSGEEPPLLEEYTYTQIKSEPRLTDIDFDVRNDQYGFK